MTAIRHSSTTHVTGPDASSGAGPVPIGAVRDLLEGLDRRQRQAVAHGDGPLLVVAGPGTGKTEVITRRVAWLIASRRARPSEILALTFTERAAEEMQRRIDVLVPYGQADTAIHTFHAFGDWLLREHGHEIGRPDDPRVIGRSEAIVLLRDNLFELGLARYLPLGDPTRFVGALADLFGRAKEEGVDPGDLAAYAVELAAGARTALADVGADADKDALEALLDEADATAELARAYENYQGLLLKHALVDHADQVAEAVRLLGQRPIVRQALRHRFRYVVVDEAQDANPQQLRLVNQMVGRNGNVTFVGDDDQAIYSFRGAVGQGLAGLDAAYDGLQDVVLRRNYRSRKPILEAARRVIRHNDPDRLEVTRGIDKTLTAVRRTRRPRPVTHTVHATSGEEADAVAADIERRLASGTSPSSMAILVRTNADAGPLLTSLEALGVPYRFSGGSGLLSDRSVRDVVSLLRTIAAPESSEDLYAVMTAKPYALGGEDLTRICETAYRRRRSIWYVVTELMEHPGLVRLSDRSRKRLGRLVEQLRASIALAHEEPAPVVLYRHLRESGWLQALVSEAERGDDGPLRRVARLFEIVKEQADLVGDPRIATTVPALRGLLDAGHDPVTPDADDLADRISVLTVHQAKGLEFPIVHIVGAADGRFPVRARRDRLSLPPALLDHPATDDPDAHLAEERRLFYVAVTRARDEVVVSHAVRGRQGGRRRRPSIFISEALGRDVGDDVPPVASALIEPPTRPAESDATRPSAKRSLALSFSQIDDYLSCPRKYWLRHRVRVPTPAHHALVFGNALHQAVAAANNARLQARPIGDVDLEATLDTHWQSEGFLSQEHESARLEAGRAALERYAAAAMEPDDEILAVEQGFSVRIGADRVRGRYDAVRTAGGETVITDYKSGDVRDPARARQRARSSLQLQLYALAWEAEHGRAPDAVELHFLESGVTGRVTPTERQLDGARKKVARVADGIRGGEFEATPGYPACHWCPYRRICPAAT